MTENKKPTGDMTDMTDHVAAATAAGAKTSVT
jgi:hypothetical protein